VKFENPKFVYVCMTLMVPIPHAMDTYALHN